MAINYLIQAQVVNIRVDKPQKDDIFLVDTNAWYWMNYTKARTLALPYQIANYPNYLNQAREVNSLLLYCGLSLAELAHNIEQVERQNYSPSLSSKEYRHNYPVERSKVIAQIQWVWSQIRSSAVSTDLIIDEARTDAILTRLATQSLDGYDLLLLEAMDKAGITQIITDDGDYATVPGIKVFTANQNVIDAARKQGLEIIR